MLNKKTAYGIFIGLSLLTFLGASDLALRKAVDGRTSDMENNLALDHTASCDSTAEDTFNCLWDGTDDSIITVWGQAFYIGSTLNNLGSIIVGLNSNAETGDTTVLGAAIEYGIRGSGDDGSKILWYPERDSLFGFTDTVAGAKTTIQGTNKFFFIDYPESKADTTSQKQDDACRVLVNVIRLITYWPDNNYVQTYLTIGGTATKYTRNSLNTNVNTVFVKLDSLR
jgi:ABC-type antimicrobial peptide transport system permease subunit